MLYLVYKHPATACKLYLVAMQATLLSLNSSLDVIEIAELQNLVTLD